MSLRSSRLSVVPSLLTAALLLLGSLIAGRAQAATVNIVGTTITGPSNCIPFGGWGNSYMGFVYKNIPAFTLSAGDTISFDLGAANDVDIRMEIAMATATSNGSMQENSSGFTTVVTSSIPSSPRGDSSIGNYELTYTATSGFVFGGGGLLIRLQPKGTMATDTNCTQVLMSSNSTDASGLFVGRFYSDPDGTYPWAGTDSMVVGEVKIVTGSLPWYRDSDGDGYGNASSVTYASSAPAGYVSDKTDCNDSSASVHPGATETCNGVDDDCDGSTDEGAGSAWYRDADGDTYGAAASVTVSCSAPAGYVSNSTDCNDTSSSIHPYASEYCNGVDDDCDTSIDESAVDATTYYADADADSYGSATSTTASCSRPSGYVTDRTDCNDASSSVHPGATEYCNGTDDDCNGTVDDSTAADAGTWYADADGDSYGNPSWSTTSCSAPARYVADATDCNDSSSSVHPGASERCNGIDDDCNGTVDDSTAVDATTYYADADGDRYGNATVTQNACSAPAGYITDATDCDDAASSVHPGATETCNAIDDDCDGTVDDSAIDASTWYADADADTYGDAALALRSCTMPAGYTGDDADCDDADPAINPDALEICDGLDNDCDGTIDLGADDALTWYADVDADTYGDALNALAACTEPAGYLADSSDCDDADAAIHPGATEVCNGLDDDCDSTADNGAVDAAVWYADADADGFGDAATTTASCAEPAGYAAASTDCDDADAAVFPGATEVCNGVDDDCDTLVDNAAIDAAVWYADADADGYGDALTTLAACTVPDGYGSDDTDCDDTDATIYPGAADVPYDGIDQDCTGDDLLDYDGDGYVAALAGGDDCDDDDATVYPGSVEVADGVDTNCDGVVDETTGWYDDDGDGYTEAGGDCDDARADVNPAATETADGTDEDCDGIVDNHTDAFDDDGDGYAEAAGDCNDGDARQSPALTEVDGNGIDDDCDGVVDDGVNDPDADGYTDLGGDCAPDDADVHPGAAEIADGKDNDCDGEVDEGTDAADADGDGATPADGDCDDTDATIGPDADEVADGVDNDCDGDVDEGTASFDDDGDGYTEEGGDCDDAQPSVHPGAAEVLNGIDDDCDGVIDAGVMDVDGDGYTTEAGDCDDTNGWVNPGLTEMCDGVDNDCDGEVDESCSDAPPSAPKTGGCACSTQGDPGAGVALLFGATVLTLLRRRARLARGATAAAGVTAALTGCNNTGDYLISQSAKQVVVSPGLVDVGDVPVGATADFVVSVTATSGSEVKVVAVDVLAIAGQGFERVDADLPTIALDETADIAFTYTAGAEGWDQAQITIQTDEESDNAHVVQARAHAAIPGAELWPDLLDLGPVAPGHTGTGAFTLDNTGGVAWSVASVAFDNPVYTSALSVPTEVTPGASIAVPVTFSPVDTTPALGTITVTLSDGSTVPFSSLRGNDCLEGAADLYDADGDGYSGCASDCDDADATAHPGGVEACDGVDNDCDGVVDNGTSCADDDRDGYTEDGGDCNDADATVHPGIDEVQGNGKDDNCDGVLDQGSVDGDGDGTSADGGDCDDADATVHTGAPELADGIDNDCDGAVDEGTAAFDDDGDGVTEASGDCDDTNAAIAPGAAEAADGADNDCDGAVDEGTVSADDDGDGYTEIGGDCDDADATVHPGAWDSADGVDTDCDGIVDG